MPAEPTSPPATGAEPVGRSAQPTPGDAVAEPPLPGRPTGGTARAVVLTGGPHPFAATTPRVVDLLADVGVTNTVVVADPDAAAEQVGAAGRGALLVLNTLRWRMQADRYAPVREVHAYATSPAVRRGFAAHLDRGGALLALHAAPICFDDWPGWRDLVGAAWRWDRSHHPPLGEVHVRVGGPHPLVDGLDDFTILDEAYGFMDLADDVEPLATARHGGVDHPLLWARRVGAGRAVTSTLGHGAESFDHPTHREILRRSVRWLLDTSVEASVEPSGREPG